MKIYAYPTGSERTTAFFAALDDRAATRCQEEARPATVEELSAALASHVMIPAMGLRNQRRQRRPYAEPSDFIRD